jgi:menaquinone-9 beta-reductase
MTRAIKIVGGGLCGLSLGIALRRRGVPVTLHEAGRYPRHRVCGEFISGVRREVLETLGLEDILQTGVSQESTVWYHGSRRVLVAKLPERALGISRWVLDHALQLRFQEVGGVLVERSRVTSGNPEGQVWCCGRVPARGQWIGLKCHVRGMDVEADLEVHLGRNGYVGAARVGDGRVNVCGLFRVDRSLAGQDVLSAYLEAGGLSVLARRMSVASVDESSRAAVAGFCLGRQPKEVGRLALGDAWGMIPPFTGNGMSMAFESAELALDPLSRYADGMTDWNEAEKCIERQLRIKFSRRLLGSQILHPCLTSSIGQSFLTAVNRSGLLPFALCFRLLR